MIEIYMSDELYSLREETTFREALFKRMDTQDVLLNAIKEQTTKTNGRVTVIETRTNDYENYKARVETLAGFKLWLMGAVAVILLFGAGGSFLLTYYWRNETKNIVQDGLDKQKNDIIKEASDQAQQKVSDLLESYDVIKINH